MAKKERISIFDSARAKVSVSKSSKDDKEVVYIDGLESKLLELEFLKAQVKDLSAQEKAVNNEIKDISREKFVELYQANKENPNTFLIKDGEGCVMVIPTDSYKKIEDKDRANQLIEEYGEDVITIEEKYYFNPKVLERNMAAVEKLIMDAKTISDDDKRNLLLPDITYSITKGYIDKLSQYGSKMQTVIDDIQPTIALKNCGGKMEEGGMMGDDFIGNVYDDEEDDDADKNDDIIYMEFIVKNAETQKEFEILLNKLFDKYFIDYGDNIEKDGYDLDYLFNLNIFQDSSNGEFTEYTTSFGVPDDDDIIIDIKDSIVEKFGDSVVVKYAKGGSVDGRSTRAKSTWNRGGAWTRDRNAHNKSEDWEKPMNKRKYAEGGGVDSIISEIKMKYPSLKVESYNNGADISVRGKIKNSIYKLQEQYGGDVMEDYETDDLVLEFSVNSIPAKFGEVYNEVVNVIMTKQNISYDEAVDIINNEEMEAWLRNMVEYHGETDANFLAEQILTTDEGKYAKGGRVPRNVGRDWIFKSKQKWEQDYDRKREYKEYKKEGWLANWFKDGGGVEISISNPKDLKEFWSNDENSDKQIFFVEEMDNDDNDTYYVVGNQTKKYYEDNQYWDYDYSFNDIDDAIEQAKKDAKKHNAVYMDNLRVTSKYAKGGRVPRNVGRDWLFKSKQKWEQDYDRKREYKEYKKEGWLANWFKDGGGVEISISNPKDLKEFWSNDENSDKQIFFVEEMDNDDNDTYYVVGNQTKKYYEDNQYWDYDYSFNDIDDAIEQAKKDAKKHNAVYMDNLRVTSKYAKGGKVPRNVGRDWIFKSKQDWEQKYDRKREWKEYKKEGWFANWFKDGGETTGDLLDLWQEMGGEKKFQEEKNYDYGSDLTDEAMVKNNLVDGEISADTLKQIVGCELSYPYQIVGAIKLQKCFMRPYYKLS